MPTPAIYDPDSRRLSRLDALWLAIWLLFLAGLAVLPPQFEWHKQLIILAIGVVQLFETRLIAHLQRRGVFYVILLKILLATWLIDHTGYQWTFAVGALCWAVLFATYVLSKQSLAIMLIQAFHGLAYVFFIVAGQKFVGFVAPGEISGSALSLLAIATNGIGLFLGTQLAGYAMEKNSVGGKFQWSKIWAVPLTITLAGAIVFAVAFKTPRADDFRPEKPAQAKAFTS